MNIWNQIITSLFNLKNSSILGTVGQETLINQMVSMNRQSDELAAKAINKRVIRITSTTILGKLARILEVDPCVLIVDKEGN